MGLAIVVLARHVGVRSTGEVQCMTTRRTFCVAPELFGRGRASKPVTAATALAGSPSPGPSRYVSCTSSRRPSTFAAFSSVSNVTDGL